MPAAKKQLGQAQQQLNRSTGRPSHSGSGSGSSAASATHSTRSTHSEHNLRAQFGGDSNVDPPGSPRSRDSRPPSPAGSSSRAASASRDPTLERPTVTPRNFDLGGHEFSAMRGSESLSKYPPRPSNPSSLGKPQKIGLNTFHVDSIPSKRVFQFRVLIGSGTERPIVIKKVWNCPTVKEALGRGWIFDGKDLAWRGEPIDRDIRKEIDLDQEDGRPQHPGRRNTFRIFIQQTNVVRFDSLAAYLTGRGDFDNSCLEAMNCIDHILREFPSKKLATIRRSFFVKSDQRVDLGGGIEASKGIYQSLRLAHGVSSGLSVNADVANGMFWIQSQMYKVAMMMTGQRDGHSLVQALSRASRARDDLVKKMKRLRVICKHRGKDLVDHYTVESFIFQSAHNYKVHVKNADTGVTTEVSIANYYARKYNIRIQHPDLPLVKMTKGNNTVLPMELLEIEADQRYPFKLDERQTASMIKFAVEPPNLRWKAIQSGLSALDWQQDPVLKYFGLKINPNKTTVNSRLLQAPIVKFGGGEAKPGTSGRWDLKGKKFLKPNDHVLKSWAVCVIHGHRGGKPDRSVIMNFVRQFCTIYTQHGGRIEQKSPAMILHASDDPGGAVTATWNAAGQQASTRPQILVFILPDKDAMVYGRIKRSAECRYGVVSQCMQYAHVQKAQAQYISNVCMKFNAKLGGITARAIGPKTGGPAGIFSVPTVILGSDVSHGAPGSQASSMAALTMSQDRLATRYSVAVETNGYRVEMITTENLEAMFKPQIQSWMAANTNGRVPDRVIYMRDGVSEGQYEHVLNQEVKDLKNIVNSLDPRNKTQFLVIVGTKRHHVRFFPDAGAGDRNGNALPGTLVETAVTHPRDNDFYLCAHAAIKGTARPVHYIVLENGPRMSNDEIYTLLYEHSYQFIRATTPVSQHPAIYYAHIAALRAAPHEPKWGDSSEEPPSRAVAAGQGPAGSRGRGSNPSSGPPGDIPKLLPMPNTGGINSAMWYI